MTDVATTVKKINSPFVAPWWLRNRHSQTMFPLFPWSWRSRPKLRRESLELPDGDVTAVDWLLESDQLAPSAPLLVIMHGLEGSSGSSYARMMMQAAWHRGWRSCVLHFRDCGDYRNRLPRRYHAGETNDLRHFLNQLQGQRTTMSDPAAIVAVGYSLGGNVLLKYLGESQYATPLSAAAAICAPLDLNICAEALNVGISKIYQRYLLKRMKNAIGRKFDKFTAAFDWDRAMAAKTFAEFDDAVTAPLHGFEGKQDYYARCSAKHFLDTIEVPTLILNALDDPFMTPEVIPAADKLSGKICLEVSSQGGHVGFVDGGTPWRPTFYLPDRILDFLEPLATKPAP